jgi:agmatine deiminase
MAVSPDRRRNLGKALVMVADAARRGAEIVCLPELFAWRYFPASRDSRDTPEKIPGPISKALSECAKENRVVLVGGTIFEESGTARYNTCLTFDENGKMLSKYRKVHIPQDEHYFEQDYFEPGNRYKVAETSKGKVGTLVCFDQWYPEAARIERLLGADIVVYPTAIGWVKGIEQAEGDWKRAWESVQVGHAIANSVVVVAVNRVGTERDTTFWGGSFVCDQFGKVLHKADGSEGIHVVECDLDLGKMIESGWGFMKNRRKETYSKIVKQ